jgi:hypothetical protein
MLDINSLLNSALIIKTVFLILNLIYIIFLFVVLKQLIAMYNVITTEDGGHERFLVIVAVVNIILGFSLLLTALAIL